MTHHACYGLPTDQLDVVVIDDSKPMQAILRTMLHAINVRRVRLFDSLKDAVEAILHEPPNLVISDWKIGRKTPYKFMKALRKRSMGQLSVVPVIIVTAHATQQVLERAMRAGAHTILVKPLAPSMLHRRIDWLIGDERELVPGEGGGMVIQGVPERLDKLKERFHLEVEPLRPSPAPPAAEPLPLEPAVPVWQLRYAETVRPPEGPKQPAETLKRMPRLNHYAALRAE
ncbi:response regulator [Oharaeibacter diazotrophicus]|uniref:Two-component system chemotaxis response regulator CheY n=1 Tax=Oharaeibacter diazotrophicus TaxID=1920512 RepID=A0A4R6RLD2_9HYPH|nr:response regulator [Oharaeibacter diazotrophicus]TDP87330.1 two-component system chemotaxis response regulator CheY [Oharaeibacter diazotrophicus]BBE70726.1 chemotaxis protein CheY [Pleomorphomonas sp. SM30]GLS77474.1 hypothetical protein GCM10007904_28110 [Oharaeibacter diazotrophicus]